MSTPKNRLSYILLSSLAAPRMGFQNSSSEARPPRSVFFESCRNQVSSSKCWALIPLFALDSVLDFHYHHTRCSIRRSGAVPIQTSASIDIELPTIKPRATTGSRARPSPKHFSFHTLSAIIKPPTSFKSPFTSNNSTVTSNSPSIGVSSVCST